jgi:hypothetical protein
MPAHIHRLRPGRMGSISPQFATRAAIRGAWRQFQSAPVHEAKSRNIVWMRHAQVLICRSDPTETHAIAAAGAEGASFRRPMAEQVSLCTLR